MCLWDDSLLNCKIDAIDSRLFQKSVVDRFPNFVAVVGKITDMLRFCEKSCSISKGAKKHILGERRGETSLHVGNPLTSTRSFPQSNIEEKPNSKSRTRPESQIVFQLSRKDRYGLIIPKTPHL